jgi:chromosome segregation ATPase
MNEYQDGLAAAIAGAAGGPARDQLSALLGQIQQMRGQLTDAVQGLQQNTGETLQQLQTQLAASKEKAAQAVAEREKILAEVAARKAQKGKANAAPIDPDLAKRLTEKLLREFGDRSAQAPAAAPPPGGKEVWEDWPQS